MPRSVHASCSRHLAHGRTQVRGRGRRARRAPGNHPRHVSADELAELPEPVFALLEFIADRDAEKPPDV